MAGLSAPPEPTNTSQNQATTLQPMPAEISITQIASTTMFIPHPTSPSDTPTFTSTPQASSSAQLDTVETTEPGAHAGIEPTGIQDTSIGVFSDSSFGLATTPVKSTSFSVTGISTASLIPGISVSRTLNAGHSTSARFNAVSYIVSILKATESTTPSNPPGLYTSTDDGDEDTIPPSRTLEQLPQPQRTYSSSISTIPYANQPQTLAVATFSDADGIPRLATKGLNNPSDGIVIEGATLTQGATATVLYGVTLSAATDGLIVDATSTALFASQTTSQAHAATSSTTVSSKQYSAVPVDPTSRPTPEPSRLPGKRCSHERRSFMLVSAALERIRDCLHTSGRVATVCYTPLWLVHARRPVSPMNQSTSFD